MCRELESPGERSTFSRPGGADLILFEKGSGESGAAIGAAQRELRSVDNDSYVAGEVSRRFR